MVPDTSARAKRLPEARPDPSCSTSILAGFAIPQFVLKDRGRPFSQTLHLEVFAIQYATHGAHLEADGAYDRDGVILMAFQVLSGFGIVVPVGGRFHGRGRF